MTIEDYISEFGFIKLYRTYRQKIRKIKEDRLDDVSFLRKVFLGVFGREIDFENPKTFNEKIQWLKLHNKNPLYTTLVDKYEVKNYLKQIIGEQYIIKTLGVWDRFDDIDFDSLPDRFVLKCTNGSGGIVICEDKSAFNKKRAKKVIEKALKTDYYIISREYPYKDVKPRVIAEEYMVDSRTKELRDYKFFCFGGEVKCFKIDFDRRTAHRANYFDVNGNLLPFGEIECPPDVNKNLELPINLNKMVELAEILSKDIPFVRVDFYEADGKVYFGEITFFPAGGFGRFTDEQWDYTLGSWIKLPEKSD